MKELIEDFKVAAKDFSETIAAVELDKQVYADGWKASQIISHVIYYQEYYSRIVKALATKQELPLITESLAKINILSAKAYENASKAELISRFKKAQGIYQRNIKHIAANTKIPYKKGGRIYTAKQYTITITGHLIKHTKDLKRK